MLEDLIRLSAELRKELSQRIHGLAIQSEARSNDYRQRAKANAAAAERHTARAQELHALALLVLKLDPDATPPDPVPF